MSATGGIGARRIRVYDQVRTAHLERARQLDPAAIVYRRRRYDFDDGIAVGLDVHRVSTLGALLALFRSRALEVEINEPMSEGAVFTAAALLGLALRRATGGPRALVVTYAIANLDPAVALRRIRRPRARALLAVYTALSRRIWRRIDRIVYGTDAARELYHEAFGTRRALDETTIPALPVGRQLGDRQKRPDSVVFLGALAERKGFPLLLAAWPAVVAQRPAARLTILGKGAMAQLADQAAARDGSISVELDPPRERIFEALDETAVLVLPSQPTPTWREQVGLPIVEGLASGCSIVTTTETGLADWLVAHGHAVIDPSAGPTALATAILEQLDHGRDPSDVLADLPDVDGRLAADAWLFGRAR
ncbi:MAG: glycosyltransferase family 4 protein [Curtobacterium sp.]